MASLEPLFQDRRDAGQKLAAYLKDFKFENPLLLALPRGGVVVADEVAKSLDAPMDVVISRKIGAPGHPEFGIGAISEDEMASFNPSTLIYFDPDSPAVKHTLEKEKAELRRRKMLYRDGHSLPDLKERSVIVIDDGLATGVTAVSAAKYLRTLRPKKLILAVPVGPTGVEQEVKENYDEVICLHSLANLRGVGLWYDDFDQVDDSEVLEILKKYH